MDLLLFLFAGYGITTIIVYGDIFESFRNYLNNGQESVRKNFWGMLINCPMCVGFWIGVLLSLFFITPSHYLEGCLTQSVNQESIYHWLYFSYNIISDLLKSIIDGAIVGSFSWSIHMVISLIKSKREYYDSKDIYYQYKMMQDEKEKMAASTDDIQQSTEISSKNQDILLD